MSVGVPRLADAALVVLPVDGGGVLVRGGAVPVRGVQPGPAGPADPVVLHVRHPGCELPRGPPADLEHGQGGDLRLPVAAVPLRPLLREDKGGRCWTWAPGDPGDPGDTRVTARTSSPTLGAPHRRHAGARHLPAALERRQRRPGGAGGAALRRPPRLGGGAGRAPGHLGHGHGQRDVVRAPAVAQPDRLPVHHGGVGRAGAHDLGDGHAGRHPGGGAADRHQVPALLQARCDGI